MFSYPNNMSDTDTRLTGKLNFAAFKAAGTKKKEQNKELFQNKVSHHSHIGIHDIS
jgi:tRNA U38,U39,U40 pseudouridine synthase TruA